MRFETLRYARDPANPLNGDTPTITDLSAHAADTSRAAAAPTPTSRASFARLGPPQAGEGVDGARRVVSKPYTVTQGTLFRPPLPLAEGGWGCLREHRPSVEAYAVSFLSGGRVALWDSVCGGAGRKRLASAARCASVSFTSSAPSASVRRSRRRAPTSGTISLPWAATQAIGGNLRRRRRCRRQSRAMNDHQRQVAVEIAALEARAHLAEIRGRGVDQ